MNHIFLHSPSAPTLTHTSAAMNKHTTQSDSTRTDVRLTGSPRGLLGIKNICLMFAMSATCKAGDAAVMQTQACKYVLRDAKKWSKMKHTAFLLIFCFVFLPHLEKAHSYTHFQFHVEEIFHIYAYIWTYHPPFLLAPISLRLVQKREKKAERWMEWKERGRER